MKKEKLENKKIEKPIKSSKAVKSKNSSNKYEVIESFCGIEKGTELVINDKQRACYMLQKKYVKKC